MKGNFKKSKSVRKYCLLLFFIIAGAVGVVKLGLLGLDEIARGHIDTGIFAFVTALIISLSILLAVFLFNNNRGAFLNIENGEIHAEFGIGESIHANVSQIRYVDLTNNFLQIMIDDRIYLIPELENSKDIYEYIRAQIAPTQGFDIKKEQEIYRKSKQKHTVYLIFVIFLALLLFVNVAWCVLLTEGKDILEFSASDKRIFHIFAVAEAMTLVLCFVFADKCGKAFLRSNASKKALLSAAAKAHKQNGLDKYPNVAEVKFFDNYVYRIVIFSTENTFTYMLEHFDGKTTSWQQCYECEKRFVLLHDLLEEVNNFSKGIVWDE